MILPAMSFPASERAWLRRATHALGKDREGRDGGPVARQGPRCSCLPADLPFSFWELRRLWSDSQAAEARVWACRAWVLWAGRGWLLGMAQ